MESQQAAIALAVVAGKLAANMVDFIANLIPRKGGFDADGSVVE